MSNKKDYLIGKTSRFSNTPGSSYFDMIKKRLDRRQFSTYKLANENGVFDNRVTPQPPPIPLVVYVDSGYWDDYYTIEYNQSNPYPTPPALP